MIRTFGVGRRKGFPMPKNVGACALALAVIFASGCSGGGQGASSGVVPSKDASRSFAALSQFTVTSSTFTNGTRVPVKMVCTQYGGNNISPQLSWKNAPAGTRAFAVIAFDTTASFAHWGIYNISSSTTSLPENTGAGRSPFGVTAYSDFGKPGYGGPCPPPGLNHRYVFTVFALDGPVYVSYSPQFPAFVEAALFAMEGHVIGQASITGFFSH